MKILGFRSGKKWKKILATLGYLMIIGTVATAANGGDGNNKTSPVIAPVKQELKQNQTPTKDTSPSPAPIVNQIPVDSTKSVSTPESAVTPPVIPDSAPKQINQDITVYGTRTGKKYHLDGCRSLGKSKIPMTLSDAKAKGLTPCSICNPPQ